jgi:predicted transcriptional regulator
MTSPKRIQISEAESIVMKVIWRKGPLGTDAIISSLGHREEWQAATVKTLLNRLLKKGAITAHKEGRRYIYSQFLTREEWLATESRGVLERLFDGQVAPLVSYFSRQGKLTKNDIKELARLIRELKDER